MALYMIFDRNAGLYQWGGDYADEKSAFAAFDAAVGIDPNDLGLDVIAEHYVIRSVTPAQYASVEAWSECGSKSSEWPL